MQAVDAVYQPPKSVSWPDLEVKTHAKVPIFVTLMHIALLWLVTFNAPHEKTKKSAQKILVHTVSLQSAPTAPPARSLPVSTPPAAHQTATLSAAPEEAAEEQYEPEAVVEPEVEPEPAPKPIPKAASRPVAKSATKPVPKPVTKPAPKPATKPKPQPKKPAKPAPKPAPKPTSKSAKKPAPTPKKPTQAKPKADAPKSPKVDQKAQEAARIKKEIEAKQNQKVLAALSSLDSASQKGSQKSSISASSSKIATNAPTAISQLASDSLVSCSLDSGEQLSPKERTYYDELVSRLKIALKMPEYGEVKLELQLGRDGKVIAVKKVTSNSKKNSDYIKKALPKINFPLFGQNFSGEKEHIFRLTLSNELNY